MQAAVKPLGTVPGVQAGRQKYGILPSPLHHGAYSSGFLAIIPDSGESLFESNCEGCASGPPYSGTPLHREHFLSWDTIA